LDWIGLGQQKWTHVQTLPHSLHSRYRDDVNVCLVYVYIGTARNLTSELSGEVTSLQFSLQTNWLIQVTSIRYIQSLISDYLYTYCVYTRDLCVY